MSIAQVRGADNQVVTGAASHPGALAVFGAHEALSSESDPECPRCPTGEVGAPRGCCAGESPAAAREDVSLLSSALRKSLAACGRRSIMTKAPQIRTTSTY